MKSANILHISTHLGGGVGRVLLSYFSEVKNDNSFHHTVACLNYADPYARAIAEKINLPLVDMMVKRKKKLLQMIKRADVVVIHWWNHPLLYDFLVRETLPPSRIVIWSHVSGFYPPSVFVKKLILYPDRFIFTTPISFKTKEVQKISTEERKRLRVIWSTTGIKNAALIKQKTHTGFNVGYIGTVDYAKLHPRFLDLCKKINVSSVKFIVCGGMDEKKIKKEAEKCGLSARLKFTGWVSDIARYFSIFDVFGYPLSSSHFGTCDQSLQESMAAGVVPVVFSNRMEMSIIEDGVTGIIAKNDGEYVRGIERLYKDKSLREFLSRNAKEYALKNFSIEKMAGEWRIVFSDVLALPKKKRRWPIRKNRQISNKDVFLESLADHGKIFAEYCNARSKKHKKKAFQKIKELGKKPAWQSKSKGTVHNYNLFLPGDEFLSLWSVAMDDNTEL